ncbi:DUF5916 domain-containing protein [Aquimarina gracilis]|uniref:DUF5916 domain-containing protein n=1 Tax=Aquimarina gracilis TaxID=874422 RepID=A0ABU5ZWY7_9FLAO|nr:DUF5916 domain-containing protein [Aquimarina gracilis]MEB3346348.1 DUF5916 domain-containing protein [Aquimarina gracilis]
MKLSAQVDLKMKLEAEFLNEPISVDGLLDEPIWKKAEKTTTFYMNFPKSGIATPDSIQTQVQVAYTTSTLYISAICYGKLQNGVFSLKRDDPVFWEGDIFGVVLDPINTKNSAYLFATNPKGVQADAIMDNQNIGRNSTLTRVLNTSWNTIWQSATQINDTNWTMEIAIPFKVLRYTNTGEWGLNFFRRDVRTNTNHTWAPVPVQFQEMHLDYTGRLRWPIPIKKSKFNFAISPYTLVRNSKNYQSDNSSETTFDFGGNIRMGISKGLNLDITINPDFSQVDVDRQVTNLTTVNIRFPEQRLFFLENSDIFSNFGIPPMRPFFSRRVGLDSDNNPIPIQFGARLSGSVNKNLRIGVMNVQTDRSENQASTNYTSLAANQRVLKQFLLKGYLHNIQATDTENVADEDEFNRVGGLELDYRSKDGKYRGSWGYGLSDTPEVNTKNGFHKMELAYNGRNLNFFTDIAGVGNNYINRIGFFPRNFHVDAVRDTTIRLGFDHFYTRLNYIIYPKNRKINFHNLGVRQIYTVTKDGRPFRYEWIPNYTIQWKNTNKLDISYNVMRPQLLFPFAFTDGEPLPSGFYHYNFGSVSYSSDRRKNLIYTLGLQNGGFYNGTRTQYRLDLTYRIKPWGVYAMNTSLDDLKFPEPYGSAKYWLIGNKTEISFSKKLFWTTFIQYNTQRDNFNINSRFQWQINALSNLFIVYTDNYSVNTWEKKNKSLVIKLNYWLDL